MNYLSNQNSNEKTAQSLLPRPSGPFLTYRGAVISDLRSATLGRLDKPRYELETYGRRAFSYAGPSAWNSLPAHLLSQNVTILTILGTL